MNWKTGIAIASCLFALSGFVDSPICNAEAEASDTQHGWTLLDTNEALSRRSHTISYNSSRHVTVMFGGRPYSDAPPFGDTWEFNGRCWLPITTDNAPPRRFWHSMVFDSHRNRIVLFGGGDPDIGIRYNDTWEYDGTDWQQIATAHSPPQMLVRTMVYDGARNRTVLVGGAGISMSYNDTWEYDGTDWVQVITPTSPPLLGPHASMAYDAHRQRAVLTLENGTESLETWEYDGSTWAQVVTSEAPLARWLHSMAYDDCSQRTVLSGGYSPFAGQSGADMNDTWEFDGNNWVQIDTPQSPTPFGQPAMAYDTDFRRVIMNERGETWAYTSPSYNEANCGVLPSRQTIRIEIDSPNMVLKSAPPLINIPNKQVGVPLNASLVIDDALTPLDPSLVTYKITHPVPWQIPDPEAIISIDTGGVAHYNSEGFVKAKATAIAGECPASSPELILATGEVYGDPKKDHVIAVFPPEYTPDDSLYSFGDMIEGFPDMMRIINLAYNITSSTYGGFRPFDSDTQIMALFDVEGHCGAAENPLLIAPQCYMNYGDGSPQYSVVIHEMGHNFSMSRGMEQLLFTVTEKGQFSDAGFAECVASLPLIYIEEEFTHNGAAYDVYPDSFEFQMAESNRDYFCSEPLRGLPGFEQLILDGLTEGIFDNDGLFDGVQVFCSMFESFSCGYVEGENPYGHQMIRRFLHVFRDEDLPEFIPEKVETYFAAAYSVAAGRDMRTKLDFWGFDIDNEYYEQIEPLIASIISGEIDILFKDGFEGEGNLIITP